RSGRRPLNTVSGPVPDVSDLRRAALAAWLELAGAGGGERMERQLGSHERSGRTLHQISSTAHRELKQLVGH
ncbi:MAG: hypothetical protein FWD17_17150, partial [Polyangiaceae bacterium]|nr:hypothetical protein [Polyangiaceae bacterium]